MPKKEITRKTDFSSQLTEILSIEGTLAKSGKKILDEPRVCWQKVVDFIKIIGVTPDERSLVVVSLECLTDQRNSHAGLLIGDKIIYPYDGVEPTQIVETSEQTIANKEKKILTVGKHIYTYQEISDDPKSVETYSIVYNQTVPINEALAENVQRVSMDRFAELNDMSTAIRNMSPLIETVLKDPKIDISARQSIVARATMIAYRSLKLSVLTGKADKMPNSLLPVIDLDILSRIMYGEYTGELERLQAQESKLMSEREGLDITPFQIISKANGYFFSYTKELLDAVSVFTNNQLNSPPISWVTTEYGKFHHSVLDAMNDLIKQKTQDGVVIKPLSHSRVRIPEFLISDIPNTQLSRDSLASDIAIRVELLKKQKLAYGKEKDEVQIGISSNREELASKKGKLLERYQLKKEDRSDPRIQKLKDWIQGQEWNSDVGRRTFLDLGLQLSDLLDLLHLGEDFTYTEDILDRLCINASEGKVELKISDTYLGEKAIYDPRSSNSYNNGLRRILMGQRGKSYGFLHLFPYFVRSPEVLQVSDDVFTNMGIEIGMKAIAYHDYEDHVSFMPSIEDDVDIFASSAKLFASLQAKYVDHNDREGAYGVEKSMIVNEFLSTLSGRGEDPIGQTAHKLGISPSMVYEIISTHFLNK